MTLIDKDEADIANLDAEDLYLGGRLYDLEPFAVEEYNGSKIYSLIFYDFINLFSLN